MRRCDVSFRIAGSCRHPECMAIEGGRLGMAEFPAIVGLIRHPQEGLILYDTGYHPAFFAATEPFPERLYRWATPVDLDGGDAIAEQLVIEGLSAADVRWAVISHFHGDHVAGLNAFPNARIACGRAGLDATRAGSRFSRVRKGVLSALLPANVDRRLRAFEDCPRVALPAEYAPFGEGADILGDGSLLAVELAGHCPGHWGLALRGEDDHYHLFVGDAAWSSRAIWENRPPPRFTTNLLGETEVYRRTLTGLHDLAARNPDLLITPAHCTERAATIRASRLREG